jgi:hypothetical protein
MTSWLRLSAAGAGRSSGVASPPRLIGRGRGADRDRGGNSARRRVRARSLLGFLEEAEPTPRSCGCPWFSPDLPVGRSRCVRLLSSSPPADDARFSRGGLASVALRGVAQSGSAPEWGSGGRRFESFRPDHDSEHEMRPPAPIRRPRRLACTPRRTLLSSEDRLHSASRAVEHGGCQVSVYVRYTGCPDPWPNRPPTALPPSSTRTSLCSGRWATAATSAPRPALLGRDRRDRDPQLHGRSP